MWKTSRVADVLALGENVLNRYGEIRAHVAMHRGRGDSCDRNEWIKLPLKEGFSYALVLVPWKTGCGECVKLMGSFRDALGDFARTLEVAGVPEAAKATTPPKS